MDRVLIRDCGPRDGLQGERPRSAGDRIALVQSLAAAGLAEVEVASFVSPKAVPAMAGAADVVAGLKGPGDTRWWALVPNVRGAELALASGIRHLTVTVSASEGYSAKNVDMTVAESLEQLGGIRAAAAAPVLVDAVVSCCFGSPFDDVSVRSVAVVVEAVRAAGVDRVTLADTTGTASPRRIAAVVESVDADVGLHLHDTRGTALTNAHAALGLGIRRFDTAVGGLGGSPFAPGAGGNLATEDLVLLLEDLGHDTGIDLAGLLAIGDDLAELVGHDLPGRVMAAGPLAPFPD
jgi:hydroxymethylglutaryl-CoA lyase